jgi:hypothetical protein
MRGKLTTLAIDDNYNFDIVPFVAFLRPLCFFGKSLIFSKLLSFEK